MSKIGRQPINLPEGVKVKAADGEIVVTGPKGTLSAKLAREIKIISEGNRVKVEAKSKSRKARMMHGTTRALIANMAKGVDEGWTKELELVGTGYRSEISGNKLVILVGFSHPVEMEIPEELSVKAEKTNIEIKGIDKEKVGQFAAKVRAIRPPEPYKGKGIRYKDEEVRRKPGKAAKGPGIMA